MSDQCPECGSDWDVKLSPGSHASKHGWRYWCGSIYYPDKDGLSTRGVACRRIQKLEAENDRLRGALKDIATPVHLYGKYSYITNGVPLARAYEERAAHALDKEDPE